MIRSVGSGASDQIDPYDQRAPGVCILGKSKRVKITDLSFAKVESDVISVASRPNHMRPHKVPKFINLRAHREIALTERQSVVRRAHMRQPPTQWNFVF